MISNCRYGGADVSLTPGNTIRYRVQACNINECGPWSTTIDLVAGGRPEAPDTPYVTSSSSSQVVLAWSYAGKDDGGVTVTHFQVYIVVAVTEFSCVLR